MAPNRGKTENLSTSGSLFFRCLSERTGQTTAKNRKNGGQPTQDHVIMSHQKFKLKNLNPHFYRWSRDPNKFCLSPKNSSQNLTLSYGFQISKFCFILELWAMTHFSKNTPMTHIWLITYKLYISFESIFHANFKNIVFDLNSPTQIFKTRFSLECVGWTPILTSNSERA